MELCVANFAGAGGENGGVGVSPALTASSQQSPCDISDLIHDGLFDSLLADDHAPTLQANLPSPLSESGISVSLSTASSLLGGDGRGSPTYWASTMLGQVPTGSGHRLGFMFDDHVVDPVLTGFADPAAMSSSACLSGVGRVYSAAASSSSSSAPATFAFGDTAAVPIGSLPTGDNSDMEFSAENGESADAAAQDLMNTSQQGPRGKTLVDFSTHSEFEAYRTRRQRNNVSSKRSRHRARKKNRETEERVEELKEENAALQRQLQTVTVAFHELQQRLERMNMGS